MIEMTWAYIAGFFDGEGCLHAVGGGAHSETTNKAKFRVTIAQSNPIGRDTLQEIADFLQSHCIKAYVLKHHNKKEQRLHPGKRRPMWNLWITQRQSIIWFVEGVFPYLRIKKQKAEDYRREVVAFPVFRGETVDAKIPRPEFIELVNSGMPFPEIAKKFGINHAGVVARARRLGLHVNTVAESNQLRSKAKIEDLLAAYKELGNYRLVAERFGMQETSVWERLNNAGVPRRKVVTIEQLQADYAELGTTVAVAEKHGLSQATVWQRLKDAGSLRTRKQVAT
jgi:DNA invertase Pin-like site-specific DNA recombinase